MYSLKKGGGVGRYFNGYLPLLNKIDKRVGVKLFLHPSIKEKFNLSQKIKTSKIKKIPFLLPNIISETIIKPVNQVILNKYWLKEKGDIFHSTYYTKHPDKDIKQVVTVYDMIHELFPQYFLGRKNDLFRKRKKQIIKSADAVICISKSTKRDLLELYKIDRENIFVVYPGKDKIFKKITNKEVKNRFLEKYKLDSPFLLYLGPRGHYKNFISLVKAFSLWSKKDDFKLVTLGGNKFSQKEKEFIKRIGLKNKVLNFGYVKDKDLVMFYNCCHALVSPSLIEGFGLPLIEAASCSTLVLCSKIPVFKEVIQNGAIYFNPKDVKSIVKALDKSLEEKETMAIIKKGFKKSKDYSWEKTAAQTLQIYKRLNKKI